MKKILFCTSLALCFALLCTSCPTSETGDSSAVYNGTRSDLRTLSADYTTRTAVCYSGFRGATHEIMPTDAEVLEDLNLLIEADLTLIRVFGSGEDAVQTLRLIHENNLDIKVQLGVWIEKSDAISHAANYEQMDAGVALANNPDYKDIIVSVSVGNEKMIYWNSWAPCPVADMAVYIEYVRGRIEQPVTTDENWLFFTGSNQSSMATTEADIANAKLILNLLDFVSIHTYALADSLYGEPWDWKQEGVAEGPARAEAMMNAAVVFTKGQYSAVRAWLDANGYAIPVSIGETGWKSEANSGETQRAHPVNQKMYYDALRAWETADRTSTGPVSIMYFEAFDEPWKGGDDLWGLFTVERKAKRVIWDETSAANEPLPAAPNDTAVYYYVIPTPVPNAENYVLYSESVTGDEPSSHVAWNVWEGTATLATVTTGAAEGSECQMITPIPGAKSWGWGFGLQLNFPHEDFTAYSAGYLVLSVKSTYSSGFDVGFQTVNPYPSNQDAKVTLVNGSYGYVNDGAWHQVVIPVADLLASNVSAMINNVFTPFMIFKQPGPAVAGDIYWDNVYWTKTHP